MLCFDVRHVFFVLDGIKSLLYDFHILDFTYDWTCVSSCSKYLFPLLDKFSNLLISLNTIIKSTSCDMILHLMILRHYLLLLRHHLPQYISLGHPTLQEWYLMPLHDILFKTLNELFIKLNLFCISYVQVYHIFFKFAFNELIEIFFFLKDLVY